MSNGCCDTCILSSWAKKYISISLCRSTSTRYIDVYSFIPIQWSMDDNALMVSVHQAYQASLNRPIGHSVFLAKSFACSRDLHWSHNVSNWKPDIPPSQPKRKTHPNIFQIWQRISQIPWNSPQNITIDRGHPVNWCGSPIYSGYGTSPCLIGKSTN